MTLSTRITPHLPFLRRFSRALMGSQSTGDSCVVAMLEALIANPALFPASSSDRVALYKLFINLHKTTFTNSFSAYAAGAQEKTTSTTLSRMNSMPRQAFLLTAVEGFDTQETLEILGISANEFAQLLDAASADISKQNTTRIMIIEDEPLIALNIEQLVENLGHEVVGIARTRSEAIQLYEREKPRMVLADIQLADGSSGIDAVSEILRDDQIPTIFITAFPERLLTGARPEPTFLINKPFNPDMLKALISQALFFDELSHSPI